MSSATTNPPVKESTPKLFSLSYSKMGSFRRCRQQYQWKYVQKIFPPSGIGQIRGTAGHAALAIWHTAYDEEQALDEAWKVWEANSQQDGKDWQLLDASLRRYFVWSRANDTFQILQSEQKFDIEFEVPPYQITHKGKTQMANKILLTGYIDGIVKDGKQLWILENKFYKRMSNTPMELDFQSSVYLLAAHILHYNVQGVIYNIIRVADTKVAVTEPVVRRKLYRNPAGLIKIQNEILQQAPEMIAYEKGGFTYRNPTKDCSWDCSFYHACLLMNDDGQEPTQTLESLSYTRSENAVEEVAVEEW